jgi:putative methyltransferase (TIGR04325 family)
MIPGRLKQVVKELVPPIVLRGTRFIKSKCSRAQRTVPEYEYIREGWAYKVSKKVHGWDHSSVAEVEKAKWNDFVRHVSGVGPLGVAHEAVVLDNKDLSAHNNIVSFAYVLAVAGHKKECLSILDYGGGLGHYFLFAKALTPPALKISYACKDLPVICRVGKELIPEIDFFDSEDGCGSRTYDLLFASGSFHYTENWKALLANFVQWSSTYIFITRLPVIRSAKSYVMIQRPHAYGYYTEYLGWVLNRDEFLQCCQSMGLTVVREFLVAERQEIIDAPEQPEYCGFLLRKK